MTMISMTASRTALTSAQAAAGQAHDHLSTVLSVSLDASVCGEGYAYRLLFETADGFRCMSERLTPDEAGRLTFALPNALTAEGLLQVQLLVYEGESVIAHTPKCTPALEIAPSITADTAIPHDYTGLTYPGVGIERVAIEGHHLIVTFEDGTRQDAGDVGAWGEWVTRIRTVDGEEREVPVYMTRGCDDDRTDYTYSCSLDMYVENEWILRTGGCIDLYSADEVVIGSNVGTFIHDVQDPHADTDAANKRYVDSLVGDIETALDGVIAIQNALIGGGA